MQTVDDSDVVLDARDYDLLAAIWVLTSTDLYPTITYASVCSRLGIETDAARALVATRPDLFRRGMPRTRIEAYRKRYAALIADPTAVLPSYLEALTPEKRVEKLNGLGGDDFFRNQFRVNEDSPVLPLELVKFGLDLIATRRNAFLDEKRSDADAVKRAAEIKKVEAEIAKLHVDMKNARLAAVLAALAAVVSLANLVLAASAKK